MRIIDKNTDFYDYLQNIYFDTSITFDRRDSFILTKDKVCSVLYTFTTNSFTQNCNLHDYNFVLLQVCNTFWLFLLETTEADEHGRPTDYTIELLKTWKNYNKERKLIKLDVIRFHWGVEAVTEILKGGINHWRHSKENVKSKLEWLIHEIDTNNYHFVAGLNKGNIIYGNNTVVEKHIPILKTCGIASCIDPLDIFLAFEEYFSLEKSSSERTESLNITDKERIENHGFDTKTSFRKIVN